MILVHIVHLAQAIGVHRNTIRNWVKSGKIQCRPGPGKGLLFTPEGFAALLEAFHLAPESLHPRELGRTWGGRPPGLAAPVHRCKGRNPCPAKPSARLW